MFKQHANITSATGKTNTQVRARSGLFHDLRWRNLNIAVNENAKWRVLRRVFHRLRSHSPEVYTPGGKHKNILMRAGVPPSPPNQPFCSVHAERGRRCWAHRSCERDSDLRDAVHAHECSRVVRRGCNVYEHAIWTDATKTVSCVNASSVTDTYRRPTRCRT